jgi:hypothetical protein
MFLLVLTMAFPPGDWKPEGSLLFWFFGHPSATATYMTLFDVGAAAFIFILGLLFARSFQQRKAAQGLGAAVRYVAIRYGLLLLLGVLIIAAGGEFIYERNGITVVSWDVIPTLGLVGFVAIPFALIQNPKIRLLVGYLWLLLYQILMLIAGLKDYAQASIHGGIYGTVFGFSVMLVVASCVGDYVFSPDVTEEKKYKDMALFGIVNLVGGILLSLVTGWEASKRQVSFSYIAISIGVTTLGLLVFALLDLKYNKELNYLRAYGMSPFFVYFIAAVPVFILDETTGDDLGLGPLGNVLVTSVLMLVTSLILVRFQRRGKVIKTEKATLLFIIVAVVLAALLLGFGII